MNKYKIVIKKEYVEGETPFIAVQNFKKDVSKYINISATPKE